MDVVSEVDHQSDTITFFHPRPIVDYFSKVTDWVLDRLKGLLPMKKSVSMIGLFHDPVLSNSDDERAVFVVLEPSNHATAVVMRTEIATELRAA